MSQFTYFVPGWTKTHMLLSEVVEIGLGHVHDGSQPEVRTPATGPEKQQGAMLAWGKGARTSFKPDDQIWQPGPKGDAGKVRWWIGVDKANRPGPEDLQRAKALNGVPVVMLDQKEWIIPIARSRTGNVTLPLRMKKNNEGRWVGTPLAIYDHLCDVASQAFNLIYGDHVSPGEAAKDRGDTVVSHDFDDIMAMVVPALQVNYRVGADELDLLENVSDQGMLAILKAVCDWDAFVEAVQARSKNESASGT